MRPSLLLVSLFGASVQAGPILWSGIFNSSFVVADFDKWSFSNEIQPWQWYIHGPGATSEYLALDPSYKNPADTSDALGIKITIDGTSFWNGQTMERSEILPQTSTNIGTGHLYYHFSLMTSSVHPPNPGYEHQIAFFESHFTEIKYGLIDGEAGTTDNTLRWDIGGVTQWSTQLVPGTWYNFAYDINFSGGPIGLWTSTGSAPLVNVKSGLSGSPSSNSADWHIGELRLPNGGTNAAPEDWYWSGIYVEQGPITTDIAGPFPGSGGPAPTTTTTMSTTTTTTTTSTTTSATPSPTTTTTTTTALPSTTPTTTTSPTTTTTSKKTKGKSTTTTTTTTMTTTTTTTTTTTSTTTTTTVPTTTTPTTTPITTTTTASAGQQTHWGQCGGNGWTGPTSCASPYTCTPVSPPYYSQCL